MKEIKSWQDWNFVHYRINSIYEDNVSWTESTVALLSSWPRIFTIRLKCTL